jgi:hypothetical protein
MKPVQVRPQRRKLEISLARSISASSCVDQEISGSGGAARCLRPEAEGLSARKNPARRDRGHIRGAIGFTEISGDGVSTSDCVINPKGAAIHIAKSGAGDPGLMFLHYWGGSSRNRRDVTDRLGGKAARHRAGSARLRDSVAIDGGYNLPAMADIAGACADRPVHGRKGSTDSCGATARTRCGQGERPHFSKSVSGKSLRCSAGNLFFAPCLFLRQTPIPGTSCAHVILVASAMPTASTGGFSIMTPSERSRDAAMPPEAARLGRLR